jgi:hypothetical protein
MTEIRRISGGGGGSGGYGGETFHGLRTDEDGLLYYNKVRLTTPNVQINLTDGSVTEDTPNTEVPAEGETYKQWLIDIDRMNIYINDNGFLVVRLNETYTHNGPN